MRYRSLVPKIDAKPTFHKVTLLSCFFNVLALSNMSRATFCRISHVQQSLNITFWELLRTEDKKQYKAPRT